MKFIFLRNFSTAAVICCLTLICTIIIAIFAIHPGLAQTKNTTDKDILKSKIIAIDPGHGGSDPGAVGVSGSKEKDINLALSLKLRDLLENNGATVVMTREKDIALSETKKQDLDARAALVKKAKADIFISMQCNATTDPNCLGAQVFFYPKSKNGETLATEIQTNLWDETQQTKKREAQTISSPYILYTVDIPAVIVEAGFLSNPREEAMLINGEYQEKVAKAVYKGIVAYYKTKPTFLNMW
ncbi:MAG: N-acetylmuramoyl-L-alanine amidase [Clostridiales bacterium]